jgi:hypothetical protein
MLLDAVFLVDDKRAARFRKQAATLARALTPRGLRLTLSGPWPPYSFLEGGT